MSDWSDCESDCGSDWSDCPRKEIAPVVYERNKEHLESDSESDSESDCDSESIWSDSDIEYYSETERDLLDIFTEEIATSENPERFRKIEEKERTRELNKIMDDTNNYYMDICDLFIMDNIINEDKNDMYICYNILQNYLII